MAAVVEADRVDPLIDVAPPHAPLPPQPRGPSATQLELNEAKKKLEEMELRIAELARENASLTAMHVGQFGARKNLPPPQHAQVPRAGNWKPPGTAIAPPLASAPAPPAVKAFNLKMKLGKPNK